MDYENMWKKLKDFIDEWDKSCIEFIRIFTLLDKMDDIEKDVGLVKDKIDYHNPNVYNETTKIGKELLEICKQFVGNKIVIYEDTDTIYISKNRSD